VRTRMMALVLLVSAVLSPGIGHADELDDAFDAARRGDYATAFPVFLLLAEQGDAAFQDLVGSSYSEGKGVSRDDREAVRWFRLAAEQGYASAQHSLGVMYSNGQGVPQDDREASKWYRLAAEQGFAEAQFDLGARYVRGQGVPQDYREALRWYRNAAAQGHPRGMAALAGMYGQGAGLPKNFVRAHMWVNLAVAAGAGETFVVIRDLAAEHLTPAQIAEAQRLARECLASNYQRCGEPGERPR
jgi:TPR repeat protein